MESYSATCEVCIRCDYSRLDSFLLSDDDVVLCLFNCFADTLSKIPRDSSHDIDVRLDADVKYFQYIRRWNVIINQMSSALLQSILILFVVWSFLIILAFGFALHVLNLTELGNERSPALTIYLAFNTIQNWGSELLSFTTDNNYAADLGNRNIIRIVFTLYVCITTLILLNLLIAIMYGPYQDFKVNKNSNHKMSECKLLCARLKFCSSPHINIIEDSKMINSSDRHYLMCKKNRTYVDENDNKQNSDDNATTRMSNELTELKSDVEQLKAKIDDGINGFQS